MRRGTWIVSFAVLVACTFGVAGIAQAGEEEKEPSQLMLIEEVTVKPDSIDAYETAVKEFIAVLAEHSFPYSFEVYFSDDYHYIFSWPIKNFADVDALFQSWMKLVEVWGWDKYAEMEKTVSGTYETNRHWFVRSRPGLSYVSDQQQYDRAKKNYILWGFCYVKPGKEKAFEKNFKDFVTMFTAKEVPFGWNTFQGDLGTEMPLYIYAEWGDGPAAFWTDVEKAMGKVEGEADALWKETQSLLRKYEVKIGGNRPDLSYRPAEEKPAEE
jgi:hypothetical protein